MKNVPIVKIIKLLTVAPRILGLELVCLTTPASKVKKLLTDLKI